MKNFKNLEMEYNGITFMNRNKARWALYFDKLRIEYLYEPEGYILSNGHACIPDFYLPGFVCFAEVKAGYMDDEEVNMAERLVEDTDIPLLILKGDPALTYYELLMPPEDNGDDLCRVQYINPVQDPNRRGGKFVTDKYLEGKEQYKENGYIEAIKAVKAAQDL